jgi:flagellar biogenesis protein FliO
MTLQRQVRRQFFGPALALAGALGATLSAHAQVEFGPPPPPVEPPAVQVPVAPVLVAPVKPAPSASWLVKRPAPKAATGKSALPSAGRLLGVVMVLGTLGALVLYLKRRGRPAALPPAQKQQKLAVVSSTRIGPRAHAVVVEVSGRKLLLGVTETSVQRLAFIDEAELDEEELEPARSPLRRDAPLRPVPSRFQAAPVAPAPRPGFADILKTAFKKREPLAASDAALVLASETRDVVGGKAVAANVRMLDVEGQAKGLLARLSEPRS